MSTTETYTRPATVAVHAPTAAKRAHREVRFGAYVLGSTLGEGEFGKVKLGWRKDGKHPSQVAIKLIKRDTIARDSESEIKIHREINLLRLLSHPNIVNLVEVLKSGKYIGIVLEYASGGELFDYILQHKYLKENTAKKLFAQLVSGVDYMHSKGLIHRDLKLENLLLDKHKNIIISDFGFVNSYNRDKNDLMKTSCGSPCYAAPELVLTQLPYSGRKVDIWSIGVILYAMLAGYLPFDDDAENEDGADIVRLYNYICSTPLTFPEYVSPLARDLLRKIIVSDPAKRISMNEIRNHPWLAPHANLLSIRQPEWDRIHAEDDDRLAAAQLMNQNSKYKRYLMGMEPTSSSALMMSSKPAQGRYASSSNVIYLNPTTSSSFANVVALSTDNKLAASASSMATSSSSTLSSHMSKSAYESLSPTKPQLVLQRGHTKSASMSGTYPTASLALKAVVSEHERNTDADVHPHHLPQSYLLRSSTYNGTIATIAESPSRAEFDKLQTDRLAILSQQTEKLPHSQKKPRPTSYHPGSMSSFMTFNNNSSAILDYMKMASPSNLPVPFLSSSPTKSLYGPESVNSNENAILGSPVSLAAMPARSTTRRNSVVTPINVNGVLTGDLNSHENKRNSVLSYLEDKIEAMDLTDLGLGQYQPDPSASKQIPKLETKLPPPLHTTPRIDQLPTFAVPTDSPSYTEKEARPVSTPKEPKREASVRRQKEERDDRTKEKDTKKKNRFSILSFYSSANTSSNSIVNSSKKSLEPSSAKKVEAATARRPELSSGKKVLEPSNDANIASSVDQKRVGSSSSAQTAQSRKSTSGAPSPYVNGRDASAARKVMNFFKRRSVRIG